MKKALSILLTILMTLAGFVSRAQAQTIWDGTADISWYDASQSSFDISTPEQLAGVAQLVNTGTSFDGKTLNLTTDIWLNYTGDSTNNWTPIGGGSPTSESPETGNSFQGAFNGHGHTIYNLYCEKSNSFHGGLFSRIQYPCTIDSLVMVNPVVKARGMMGAIAGFTRSGSGAIYIRYCLVINARLEAPQSYSDGHSNNNSACILGAAYNNSSGSYIQNCGATGTLTGYYVAGICASGDHSYMTNCYFAGTLHDYGSNHGGMTAWSGTLSNCYSYTNVPAAAGKDGTSVTQAAMQAPDMITNLGDAFKLDNGINNGYPIMSYMAGVDPTSAEICQGENITLTAFGFDTYLWSNGSTADAITVSPTTTTTYTVTCTANGTPTVFSIPVTVHPQAVVTATVAASSDGQVHATVSPETTTVPCGSSDNVTFTVTPDEHWRVASVYMNGTLLYGEQTYGPFSFTVNPGGTLADVVINMTDALSCTGVLNLQASNIFGTNATVSWNAHTTGDLSEYHILVYDLTNMSESEYTTTDLSYTIMGLSENTSYQIGVYTFCLDGYGSDTMYVNFMTPCNSPIPVTVGSGTSSSQGQYFPNYTFYNYSYTQQIITAAELNNEAQTFSAMAFQYFLGTALTRNLDIYLAHVPASANLASAWILPDSANGIIFTQVFSGQKNLNNSGTDYWLEFPFSQSFAYNGTDNLLVAVLDHTGSYTNSSEKYYTHSAPNMSRYVYRDASTYDPFGPDASGTAGNNVNNIRFIFCDQSTCIRPNTLTVSNITDNSADLSWVSAGSESSWEIEYKTAADTAWTYYGQASTTSETILMLNADTRYYMRVRAVCGSNDVSLWSDPINFRTQCGPITQLPYFNNFDEVISDNGTNFITCWSRLTTNPDRVVRCYTSATHSAPYSLDFNYSPSCTTAAVTPMLDASIPLNTVMVDFWATSSLGQGWMEVGTMSDPTDFSTYEFYDTVRLSAPSTWENLMISFENYTGTNQYIAFLEINGTSTSYIFDDFTINYIPVCLHPTNLAVDGLTNTTVTLSWTEAGDATMWEIEYGPTGFTPGNGTTVTAYTTPFTVDNLTPATTYDFYVYANCGSEMSDPFGPVSATPGQYIFGVTGSDTLTTCGVILYDDGGPSGDYSNYGDFTLVIYPENPNAVVALNGTSSTESCCDYLRVYDGVGTSGQQLHEYKGENLTVDVMSQSGPLTLVFHSDLSVVKAGFAITATCVTCYPPYGVTASNVMTTSANLNWNGSGNGYLVYVTSPTGTDVISATDTFLLLDNLTLNTTYSIAVQTLCDDGDSSMLSSAITFTTPTIPATLPYAADFEDASDNSQWGILNGTQTNKWYIDTPTDATSDVNTTVGGSTGLYVSNDNGASNTYTGTTSRVYAFRDILVPDGVTELKLSFDWKAMGGSAHDEFLRVYWLDPAVVTVTAGNNPPSVGGVNYDLYGMPGYPTLGAHWLSQQNTWQHEEMLISATQFEGMGNGDRIYRLYFHWRNTSGNSNPPAAVDNISLSAVTCATPLNVTVSNIGENTATVSWSGTADQFGVTVISATDTNYQTATDTFIVLNGLNANTIYQVAVRGYCGGDSSMISQGVQFTTACGAITSVPYLENFDTYSSMNGSNFINCWYRHASDPANHWVYVNSGSDAYSGGSLDFHYTPNCFTMAVTPMIDPSIPLNTLMVDGMTRIHLNGTAGVFEVGTMSDPNDTATFTPYDTIEYSATFTWLPFTTLFNNYTGSDHYIAFRAMNGVDVSYLLDNITIDVIPACWHPVNPMVSNITNDGATITWDGTAANYVIEYGPVGFTEGTGTSVNVTGAMSYTLSGLNETTDYTVYISSDCGSDGLSSSVSVNFQTTMLAAAIPYSTDFSDPTDSWILNNGSCTNTWVRGTVNGSGALFVSQDGTTPGYSITSTSQVSAEKLFTVGTDATVTVQFDIQVGGESSFDYFKLFLAPPTQEYPAATSVSSTDYGYNSYSQYAYNFYSNNYGSNSTYPYIMNLTNGNTVHVIAVLTNPISNPDANSTAKLVFAWKNDGTQGTQPGAIITNLQVGPITCPSPSNLTVTNVTMTTADVSWTAGGTETAWNLEYKESTATTWTVIPVTTNTYQLSNLTAATSYDVRVQADCGGGDNSLYTATSFGTTLCASSDQCAYIFNLVDSYGDGWNNATLEVLQNGIHVTTMGMGSGNSSATETVMLCDNMSTSLVWHSGNYDSECSFTVIGPDGSQVYASSGTPSAGTLTTFTTSCSGYTPEPVDPTVATNAASAIAQTSATLNATITNPDDVTITAKGFEWKTTDGSTYTQIAGTGTGNTFTANLTGLTPGTGYIFKAFITFNGQTVYGSELTFTTLPDDTPEPCETPTNVTIGNVTDESITMSWDADPDVASWNIQYRPVGGTLSSATATTNSYTITGLTPETEYQIQVQANCGDGNLSEWSTIATATTTVGLDSWLAGSVALYPNPAKEVVNVQCTMNNVQWDNATVEVFDVYGKLLQTERMTSEITTLNVSGLADGMYFVRVTTEEGMVTKTFVKK
jgi:hypothetical protein